MRNLWLSTSILGKFRGKSEMFSTRSSLPEICSVCQKLQRSASPTTTLQYCILLILFTDLFAETVGARRRWKRSTDECSWVEASVNASTQQRSVRLARPSSQSAMRVASRRRRSPERIRALDDSTCSRCCHSATPVRSSPGNRRQDAHWRRVTQQRWCSLLSAEFNGL